MKTCPKCGSGDFLASQPCRGTITAVVEVDENNKALFIRNPTPDGMADTSGLDFDNPEPPYTCFKCGYVME
jgi:ribosomal protein S27AE